MHSHGPVRLLFQAHGPLCMGPHPTPLVSNPKTPTQDSDLKTCQHACLLLPMKRLCPGISPPTSSPAPRSEGRKPEAAMGKQHRSVTGRGCCRDHPPKSMNEAGEWLHNQKVNLEAQEQQRSKGGSGTIYHSAIIPISASNMSNY